MQAGIQADGPSAGACSVFRSSAYLRFVADGVGLSPPLGALLRLDAPNRRNKAPIDERHAAHPSLLKSRTTPSVRGNGMKLVACVLRHVILAEVKVARLAYLPHGNIAVIAIDD